MCKLIPSLALISTELSVVPAAVSPVTYLHGNVSILNFSTCLLPLPMHFNGNYEITYSLVQLKYIALLLT